jgi:microcystin-dependent protein
VTARTAYGGDGRTTCGLSELRGPVAMHASRGPGLPTRPLGQKSGTETVTVNKIPRPPAAPGSA